MNLRAFKYFSPLVIFAGALHSFTSYGLGCYMPLIYAWVFIPLAELMIPADGSNLSQAEEVLAINDRTYDFILYAIVFLQLPTLYLFLFSMQDPGLHWFDKAGRIATMGLLCGTFGINIGHELGHRKNAFEQWLAKLSLMLSLYMHFFIEHNKGHHKHVATPDDPSSSRLGEPVYKFWIRSICLSYASAWKIANEETTRHGKSNWSLSNQMIQMHFIEGCFTIMVLFLFGLSGLLYFLSAALIGILLLETVNYIEHYGLMRRQVANGKFERAMPCHSWNSNHVIGRIMLFELSRHSDHHYLASRKYQVLRHHEGAPQMPTGYPGMMILSLFPPLWFYIMDKRVKTINNTPSAYPPIPSRVLS